MTFFGRTISRLTLGVVGIIFIIALIAFGTSQCARQRNAASQARVDAGQAAAASESAKNASQVQSTVNANEVASEALGRTNEQEIRNAQGSNAVVSPAARDAGLLALCRRASYRDREQCKLLNAR